MSRNINPFGLRMPAELKEKLEEEAKKNMRSLNAELVARLEESFGNNITNSSTNQEIAELTYQVKLLLQVIREKEQLGKVNE
ncbi:Arc family DNA-binding protein [Vibrio cholerae]|uniref:Arc family DNA-binding protein n=1 Tax=Vibrio cholerae TaxID=666 RepID=UPI00155DFA3C|nr:Arc family DNA-binding protein [Vibrio cholerae]EGR4068079.1 Arc family DNA-binding protein [Vibrio cholerae]EJL7928578.1 Arc family DNA-binding protein [Vibrio cholerae]ELI1915023.1 Arc family DNA-binding protein [Vibrio cholerae]ELJ8681830.1 Arc family DNA-binding protein [Vibrio cholerae]ELY5265541.1 Arc family DNA-binding protein [Vibrio cholerae]